MPINLSIQFLPCRCVRGIQVASAPGKGDTARSILVTDQNEGQTGGSAHTDYRLQFQFSGKPISACLEDIPRTEDQKHGLYSEFQSVQSYVKRICSSCNNRRLIYLFTFENLYQSRVSLILIRSTVTSAGRKSECTQSSRDGSTLVHYQGQDPN